MMRQQNTFGLVIILVLCSLVASVLSIVELPVWMFYFRPDWVALVVIYWVLALPERLGVIYGFLNGFLLDLLLIKVLGLNVFGLSCLAFAVARTHMQMRMFPIWQQALLVGVLIAVMKLVVGWIASWVSDFQFSSFYWYSIVADVIVWPFMYIIMRDLRRSIRL